MRNCPVLLLLAASLSAGWTVCLDPGHGGSSTGAIGDYYQEKAANLDVANEVLYYLSMVPDCDWVGMTRTGDYDVSLQARCDYANQNGFDRFMSIHENAFNTTVQGTEVFYETGTPAYDLATQVLDGILWAHGYPDRGLKDGDWLYVVANTEMPAILGEGTFIDYDLSWNESYRYYTNWNDHEGRQGWAYAAGICLHMGSTPPAYGSSGDVIVDNLDDGFSVNDDAEWNSGSYGVPWVYDYRWSLTANQTDWARWTPVLPQAGWYEVFVWYVEGTNRAPDALFTVHHADGDSQFSVDQTEGGEQWNLLGGFGFEAGTSGWVTLSETGVTPGKVVIADAVRFLPISTGIEEGATVPRPGSEPSMSVGPNPSSSFRISVVLPEAGTASISVFDMSGRLQDTVADCRLPVGESVLYWVPDALPEGVYAVVATTGEWRSVQRVVLAR